MVIWHSYGKPAFELLNHLLPPWTIANCWISGGYQHFNRVIPNETILELYPHYIPIYSHYIHILFTFYSHYIHIIFTFYSHSIHIIFTLYSHYIHILFTLYSHSIHIIFTFYSLCILDFWSIFRFFRGSYQLSPSKYPIFPSHVLAGWY